MDWLGIIGTHVLWKKRLIALLDGTSQETLEPAAIGVDNKCALGKWIYGEGHSYSDAASYDIVRTMHADFHRMAANVVALYQLGKNDEAEHLLHQDYSRLSEKLKHKILALSHEVKSRQTTPLF
jgi:methyl-accepting chemotaxis protein